MNRTIMVINPNTTAEMTDAAVASAAPAAAEGTILIGATAARGVAEIESHTDEVWGALGVLNIVTAAERDHTADAYVIACFGDTGAAAAREIAAGPVIGMTEAALFTAALIAHRFSIVTLPPRTMRSSDRVLTDTGLRHRCTVRAIDVGVADLVGGSSHLLEAFAEQARAAMAEDRAEAIVLGCAGLSDLVAPLAALLGAPVIDGVAAAVTMAEGLISQGLSTSRVSSYAPPPRLGPA